MASADPSGYHGNNINPPASHLGAVAMGYGSLEEVPRTTVHYPDNKAQSRVTQTSTEEENSIFRYEMLKEETGATKNAHTLGWHCHSEKDNGPHIDKKARRKLIIACVMCLLFMIGEFTGGILANSLAIATDAAHMMTDFASFLISLFALYLASRQPTKRMSFGWYRAEVMGALISVLMIWVLTGILVYMAIERVITGEYEIGSTIMVITASCGVLFNIVMAVALHDSGHGHSHGFSHGHSHGSGSTDQKRKDNTTSKSVTTLPDGEATMDDTSKILTVGDHGYGTLALASGFNPNSTDTTSLINGGNKAILSEEQAVDIQIEEEDVTKRTKKTRKSTYEKKGTGGSNMNVRAAFIHVIGDLFNSIGVLVAAVIIFFKPEYKIADPICTFVFSVLVLITTLTILRDALNILMEATPRGINFSEVREMLCDIDGVRELHNLRIWSLTVSKVALSVHLAIDKAVSQQTILSEASELLYERFDVHDVTIQMEHYVIDMDDCTQCQDPRD